MQNVRNSSTSSSRAEEEVVHTSVLAGHDTAVPSSLLCGAQPQPRRRRDAQPQTPLHCGSVCVIMYDQSHCFAGVATTALDADSCRVSAAPLAVHGLCPYPWHCCYLAGLCRPPERAIRNQCSCSAACHAPACVLLSSRSCTDSWLPQNL
jgi:hypothetical protein